jgi:TolA-binding protein
MRSRLFDVALAHELKAQALCSGNDLEGAMITLRKGLKILQDIKPDWSYDIKQLTRQMAQMQSRISEMRKRRPNATSQL